MSNINTFYKEAVERVKKRSQERIDFPSEDIPDAPGKTSPAGWENDIEDDVVNDFKRFVVEMNKLLDNLDNDRFNDNYRQEVIEMLSFLLETQEATELMFVDEYFSPEEPQV